jgi:hypothetical protein
LLARSFNRDGEDVPGVVEERDKKMDLNGAETRKERADLQKAKVDQLKESGASFRWLAAGGFQLQPNN